jgi:ketopantoate hydroxymethyltransferase
VLHDLLGLGEGAPPRFAREYVSLTEIVAKAAHMYAEDVRNQKFPAEHEQY